MKAIEFIGAAVQVLLYTYKLASPRKAFYLTTFFSMYTYITNVFCAKKRVGHACICPRMVTS